MGHICKYYLKLFKEEKLLSIIFAYSALSNDYPFIINFLIFFCVCSSSINYFRYGLYVLVGLVWGLGEPVLYHRSILFPMLQNRSSHIPDNFFTHKIPLWYNPGCPNPQTNPTCTKSPYWKKLILLLRIVNAVWSASYFIQSKQTSNDYIACNGRIKVLHCI